MGWNTVIGELIKRVFKKEDLETYKFIKMHEDLFMDTQDKYKYSISRNTKMYTILNYKKIFEDMCEYLEGYLDYYNSDDDKYENKVISSTAKYYDSFFTDKKYRMDFVLHDIYDIKKDFLEGTKDLQEVLLKLSANEGELHSMTILTNNQYGRLSKVFNDDMQIWKMLIDTPAYHPTAEDRRKFSNPNTPCIHEKKKENKLK